MCLKKSAYDRSSMRAPLATGCTLSTTRNVKWTFQLNRSQFVHNRKRRGSRRDFLQIAGAFAAGTTCGNSQVKAVAPDSPQIGILLATRFTSGALEARLDRAKACGLACLQMPP